MNRNRKEAFVALLLILIVPLSFIYLGLTGFNARVSVPADVRNKLDSDLIESIETGWRYYPYDCTVLCNSRDDMNVVIDVVGNDNVEVSQLSPSFQAFLAPEQIFSIARMDEVEHIELTTYITVHGQIDWR